MTSSVGMRFSFAKGRVALHALLEALDIGPGDQVLLPGYTCVVVPNAIRYRGATPVFIDISPDSYNLDADALRATRGSTWDPDRAKALIVQHTYGIPAEFDELAEVARENHMAIIEDSCHALESRYRGRPVGTLGDAAFFSSQWSKPITTGLGGWAVASNPVLEDRLRRLWAEAPGPARLSSAIQLAQYAAYVIAFRPSLFWKARDLYRRLSDAGVLVGSSTAADFGEQIPSNYRQRMSAWQSQLAAWKLNHFSAQVEHSQQLTRIYDDALLRADHSPLTLPSHLSAVLLRYPLRVPNKLRTLQVARAKRVEVGDWFLSPIHPIEEDLQRYGYLEGSCPEGERASREVVNLPLHPKVSQAEAQRIAQFIVDELDGS